MPNARTLWRVAAVLLAALMTAANYAQQYPQLVGQLLPPQAVVLVNVLVPLVLAIGHELLHQFPALDATPTPAAPAPQGDPKP